MHYINMISSNSRSLRGASLWVLLGTTVLLVFSAGYSVNQHHLPQPIFKSLLILTILMIINILTEYFTIWIKRSTGFRLFSCALNIALVIYALSELFATFSYVREVVGA